MKAAFSLGWRLLLVLALALNPAAFAMAVEREDPVDAVSTADVPPCHDAGSATTAAPDPATSDDGESAGHGCDCGNPACEFAACCAVGALVPSVQFIAVAHARNHLAGSANRDGALPPPPSRLIRPPIA